MSKARHAVRRPRVRMSVSGVDGQGHIVTEKRVVGPRTEEQLREQGDRNRAVYDRAVQSAGLQVQALSDDAPDDPWSPGRDIDADPMDVDAPLAPIQQIQPVLDAFMRLKRPRASRTSAARSWTMRYVSLRANWSEQRDALVTAYLELLHSQPASGAPPPAVYPDFIHRLEYGQRRDPGRVVLIDISGIYSIPVEALGMGYRNVALVHRGYLGAAPMQPGIAFSLRLLMQYLRLKTRGRTAKQNYIRALCDLHNVPYLRSLTRPFSDAMDALTMVLRDIDSRVAGALGRTGDWRMRNACPACSYKCEAEPPLRFARQYTMDGNNSLKRFTSGWTPFLDFYPSQYILTRETVNECDSEVARRAPPSTSGPAIDRSSTGIEQSECEDRWKNMRSDSQKKASWDALEETGIFVCVCRHGFVFAAADMVQSGELAKYALSIDKKLIELFQDEGVVQLGYDVNCGHSITASRSTFGTEYKRHIFPVNGRLHGHAHNRLCQLKNHPDLIEGSGREPFEGCEQLFSVTNLIASLVRHATRWHRHEDIDRALAAWDQEKYAGIGGLLLSKYNDASAKLVEHKEDVREAAEHWRFTDDTFKEFLRAERAFLESKSDESPATTLEQLEDEYVRVLDLLWAAQVKKDKLPRPSAAVQDALTQGRVRAPRNSTKADKDWLSAHRDALRWAPLATDLEDKLQLAVSWTPTCPEYRAAVNARAQRTCNSALHDLEVAVVARIHEMEKMNVRNTGYNLRQLISKELSRRSGAILKLLDTYNTAARACDPPRTTLRSDELLNAAFLADFALLRYDTGEQPWAQRRFRELTRAWAATKRANEEIQRIRIECVRIRTWIIDEELSQASTIRTLSLSADTLEQLLARELDSRAYVQSQMHTKILEDLDKLDALDGHNGSRTPGWRANMQHTDEQHTVREPRTRVRWTRLAPYTRVEPGIGVSCAAQMRTAMPNDAELSDDSDHELDEEEQQELDSIMLVLDAVTS